MARIIGAERNEIIFNDPLSGTKVALYYRHPTTSKRQGYMNDAVKRVKGNVTFHRAEALAKWGAKVLVGIREGDFLRMVDGKPASMSSDPASPDYYDGWREEIEAGCGDLISAMAAQVFDVVPDVVRGEDLAGE